MSPQLHDPPDPNQPRVVILGGGFGGAYCAQALCHTLRRDEAQIALVDRHNFFAFTPLLIEAGTGDLEPRHAVVPLRSFVRNTQVRMGEIERVDLARRRLHLRLPETDVVQEIGYDHLVLALGSVTRTLPIDGLERFGFQMKSLHDAVVLRDRAVRMLEIAEALPDPRLRRTLLTFVVIGGNFSGVELAGALNDFLREGSKLFPHVDPDDINVVMVERGNRILDSLPEDLAAYATQLLRRHGVEIRFEDEVVGVGPDSAELKTGQILGTRTVVSCAGVQQNPLAIDLDLPRDERGYILCEPDMRVQGQQNVWGIGDCAVNPDPRTGKPYPPTAQHAVRQGKWLARNIAAVIRGQPARPAVIKSPGQLAALGSRRGVAKVFGVNIAGFPAWFLWRSVYLSKMPGLGRKARIALDWTTAMFFSRDYVQLAVHRRPEPEDQINLREESERAPTHVDAEAVEDANRRRAG